MPRASIIVPAYNVAATLAETLQALLAQTFADFEIVIVNDGSTDDTARIAQGFCHDSRVRIVTQANRGLAGARNTGIAAARGAYIGFCDADDLWVPRKLAAHVAHLDARPEVGLSFSGSELINEASEVTGCAQRPRLTGVTAAYVLKRNPVGNGSAPVLRRAALDDLAYYPEGPRAWYFDETFRQSEDIECWLRLALTTDWTIEGVRGLLTRYRINGGGLSAATDRQRAAWERMITKLTPLNPGFFARHTDPARAYQLRYLARRAVSDMDGPTARRLLAESFAASWRPLAEEPLKTAITLGAAAALTLAGGARLRSLSPFATGPAR